MAFPINPTIGDTHTEEDTVWVYGSDGWYRTEISANNTTDYRAGEGYIGSDLDVDGSVTADSFIPTSSTVPTNGVYLPAANNVAISTNGTGRLFVDVSGNVGVGAVPAFGRKLHVQGIGFQEVLVEKTDTFTSAILLGADAGVAGIYTRTTATNSTAIPLGLFTGTTERLRITSTGALNFVGAGTAGSTQAVSFNGSAPVNSLVIDSSGRLGVGTSSPQRLLTTKIDSNGAGLLLYRSSEANNDYGGIEFGNHTSDIVNQRKGAIYFVSDGRGYGRGSIYICNDGAGNTDNVQPSDAQIVVTSTGHVGVGTTSPGEELQIGSTTSVSSTSPVTLSLGGQYTPQASISLSNLKLKVYDSSTDSAGFTAGQDGLSYICGKGQQHIWYRADGAGTLFESFRSDTSGRLLVGTSTARSNVDGATPQIQLEGTTETTSTASIIRNSASGGGAVFVLGKSRSASVGGNTIVNSGDTIGTIAFEANDGTNFISAAGIAAQVDGTPAYAATALVNGQTYRIVTVGTTDFTLIGASANTVGTVFTATGPGTGTGTAILNAGNMPGRLVFSTTADGASSPTERVRITSSGYLKVSNSGSYYAVSNPYHEFLGAGSSDLVAHFENTTSTNPYGIRIRFSGASPNDATRYFLNCIDSGSTVRAEIRSNGGLANYQANDVNLSDRNVKKDISPAAGTWDCIKEWEIVNYRYKDQPDDADLNLGVIAQQVAESCPEVITVFQEATEDQPEKLGVKEQQMYWMAIKALQEAQVRIEQLETKVAALESA